MKRDPHTPTAHSARFRFYEELNDFLPPGRRKQAFTHCFFNHPSVKDTVEALGVPHPEIDVILVNGESVGFDYRLRPGDDVAVFPVFESFDVSPLQHLRPKPLRTVRFVVDSTAGRLLRKLRLLGLDSLDGSAYSNSEIIGFSLDEDRIILTRNRKILKNSRVIRGFWLRHENPDMQVQAVVRRFQLENCLNPFSRCTVCNVGLQDIAKEDITERVPKRSRVLFREFRECRECGRVYWKGSHYERLCRWMERLGLRGTAGVCLSRKTPLP